MKELTIERRHEIYKESLSNQKAFELKVGLCRVILNSLVKTEKVFYNPYDKMELFPEIFKHKPENSFGFYWFPFTPEGIQKRIDILEQAIKETEK